MVVIKHYGNISPKETICTKCKSELEYTYTDTQFAGLDSCGEPERCIYCPVCGQKILLKKGR